MLRGPIFTPKNQLLFEPRIGVIYFDLREEQPSQFADARVFRRLFDGRRAELIGLQLVGRSPETQERIHPRERPHFIYPRPRAGTGLEEAS